MRPGNEAMVITGRAICCSGAKSEALHASSLDPTFRIPSGETGKQNINYAGGVNEANTPDLMKNTTETRKADLPGIAALSHSQCMSSSHVRGQAGSVG